MQEKHGQSWRWPGDVYKGKEVVLAFEAVRCLPEKLSVFACILIIVVVPWRPPTTNNKLQVECVLGLPGREQWRKVFEYPKTFPELPVGT